MTRVFLLAVTALLVAAAPASGRLARRVIRDCADDVQLQGTYTHAELRRARQNLPSHVGGRPIEPRTAGISTGAARSDLPAPLIVARALLGLLGAPLLTSAPRRRPLR